MQTKKLFLWLGLVAILSCNKKFDEPPAYIPPNYNADLSIADLKAMHSLGKFDQINVDKTISGVVIADDESGQFYKTVVIQDSTGGISVKLDGYDLYTKYPIGRQIFIKVKGLFLGDFHNLIELGIGVDNSGTTPVVAGIPSPLFDGYIFKGTLNNVITPQLVKVAELNDSYQNTLIQLDNFEFATSDLTKTYADTSLGSSAVNFTISSCSGESIILRNSSYAEFAGYHVPNGNGAITAVYTIFGTTKQLNIRDTSDVKFYNPRCGNLGNGTFISVADLRDLYSGSDVVLSPFRITGIVISDIGNKNLPDGMIVLQDRSRGIALNFGSSTSVSNFHLGDSIVVDVTGGTLTTLNGSLQINLSAVSLPSVAVATGKTIAPQELNIQEINTNLPKIEYTLVKIIGGTVSGGVLYSDDNAITDATGSIAIYTSHDATFASDALPAGSKTWTGYCKMNNSTKQFLIRNTGDIEDDTTQHSSNDVLIISEYVEGSSYNKYLEIYNAGTDAADLSKYSVNMYTNGSAIASNTAQLDLLTGSSSLAAGGIIVLQNSSASLTLPAGVTAFTSSVCSFNGDDAITIEKNGVIVDVFGQPGIDPGTSWTIAGMNNSAVDKTVRRKSSIAQGNTDWISSSANEWDVISTTDDISNLGTR